jgi:putative PIN family toxin of toxin-antitoxin system
VTSPAVPIPKVVLDSNVLLRALLSRTGPSAELLEQVLQGRIQLVLSPTIVREVRKGFFKPTVRQRYPLSLQDIAEYLARLQRLSVLLPADVDVKGGSRDPKDNPILACAVSGGADFLITDDRRHLLPMKHFHGVQIVSVPDFLKRLRRR